MEKSDRLEIRTSPEWLARLDEWREAEGLGRSEAVRYLVGVAIEDNPRGKAITRRSKALRKLTRLGQEIDGESAG